MSQSSSSGSDSSRYDTGIIFPDEDEFDQRFASAMDSQIEAEILGTGRCRRSRRRQRRSRKRIHIDRNREAGNALLVKDYFSNNPTYTNAQFRRRFRMRRHVFRRIVDGLEQWSEFFQQRRDALNKNEFSPLQKCTVAMRMLGYGSSADSDRKSVV